MSNGYGVGTWDLEMLGFSYGSEIDRYVKDYVIFDLETTGVNVDEDEIIEISAVRVKDGRVEAEFSQLVNPGRHIPREASVVNGISDAMVKDCPCFEKVLDEFLDFIEDYVLVGHNIKSFDLKFIYRDVMKYRGMALGNDYVDTWHMAKRCLPQLKHKKLTDLAQFYGISPEGAHRALNDCRMNQKVYEKMACAAPASDTIRKCPRCGSMLVKRKGMYGEFYGCSGFPDCRYTEKC